MKLNTFVKQSFQVIRNKSARICLNVFGNSVIQSFKRGKKRKSGLVSMSRQEKLADLTLVFPARLETWPKAFHSYPFIKCSRNEAFRHFFVKFYQTVTMETMTVQKFWLQFWVCISMLYDYKASSLSSGRRKSYQWSKFSNFLFPGEG